MVRLCIAEACIQHSVRVCKGAAAALRAAAVQGLFILFILVAAVARPAAVLIIMIPSSFLQQRAVCSMFLF